MLKRIIPIVKNGSLLVTRPNHKKSWWEAGPLAVACTASSSQQWFSNEKSLGLISFKTFENWIFF
jgi:hypothetical protein